MKKLLLSLMVVAALAVPGFADANSLWNGFTGWINAQPPTTLSMDAAIWGRTGMPFASVDYCWAKPSINVPKVGIIPLNLNLGASIAPNQVMDGGVSYNLNSLGLKWSWLASLNPSLSIGLGYDFNSKLGSMVYGGKIFEVYFGK